MPQQPWVEQWGRRCCCRFADHRSRRIWLCYNAYRAISARALPGQLLVLCRCCCCSCSSYTFTMSCSCLASSFTSLYFLSSICACLWIWDSFSLYSFLGAPTFGGVQQAGKDAGSLGLRVLHLPHAWANASGNWICRITSWTACIETLL